jgi:hypothetical protein
MVPYLHISAILGLVLAQSLLCAAFSFTPKTSSRTSLARRAASSDTQTHESSLASAFPPELPAGMRGEAVRSTLRSPNGVCFDLTSRADQFGVGVVKVDGSGVRQFLEGKLSNSFDLGETQSDAHGKLVDSCLLTPRGRTVDRISVSLFPGIGCHFGQHSWTCTTYNCLLFYCLKHGSICTVDMRLYTYDSFSGDELQFDR